MADNFKRTSWEDELPIGTNQEFEIGYRSDELASPMETYAPELAMEAAAG